MRERRKAHFAMQLGVTSLLVAHGSTEAQEPHHAGYLQAKAMVQSLLPETFEHDPPTPEPDPNDPMGELSSEFCPHVEEIEWLVGLEVKEYDTYTPSYGEPTEESQIATKGAYSEFPAVTATDEVEPGGGQVLLWGCGADLQEQDPITGEDLPLEPNSAEHKEACCNYEFVPGARAWCEREVEIVVDYRWERFKQPVPLPVELVPGLGDLAKEALEKALEAFLGSTQSKVPYGESARSGPWSLSYQYYTVDHCACDGLDGNADPPPLPEDPYPDTVPVDDLAGYDLDEPLLPPQVHCTAGNDYPSGRANWLYTVEYEMANIERQIFTGFRGLEIGELTFDWPWCTLKEFEDHAYTYTATVTERLDYIGTLSCTRKDGTSGGEHACDLVCGLESFPGSKTRETYFAVASETKTWAEVTCLLTAIPPSTPTIFETSEVVGYEFELEQISGTITTGASLDACACDGEVTGGSGVIHEESGAVVRD